MCIFIAGYICAGWSLTTLADGPALTAGVGGSVSPASIIDHYYRTRHSARFLGHPSNGSGSGSRMVVVVVEGRGSGSGNGRGSSSGSGSVRVTVVVVVWGCWWCGVVGGGAVLLVVVWYSCWLHYITLHCITL